VVALGDLRMMAGHVGLAHGGHPVGEEHHHPRRAPARGHREGLAQRGRDGRAAAGVEAVDEAQRALPVVGRGRERLLREGLHVGAEAQDVEGVVGVEPLDPGAQGLARVLHLLARHRARGVDDEEDVLADDLALGGSVRGASIMRKYPSSPGGRCVSTREPDVAVGDRVEEVEIAVEGGAALFEAHGHRAVAAARGVDAVRGGVHPANGHPRRDGGAEGEVLHRARLRPVVRRG
jgi:hypothetical protein